MIIFTVLKIAGGNSTALISKCPKNLRNKTIKQLLKKVEQVGFISENKLTMMGNELCINATLAFASQLKNKGILYTGGVKKPIKYKNENNQTIIKIPLKYKIQKNVILFEGIGYICIKDKKKATKTFIKNLAKKYKLSAFGAIVYEKNKINPYIYVKQVGSFVNETACGSGSIAFSLFSGYKKIIQPTGESIYIKVRGKEIEIKAKVTKENINKSNKLIKLKKEVKMNILFICKYNRFRSRVAEAYFKKINKNKKIQVNSAGAIQGNPVSKLSAKTAKELGININGKPKGISSKLLSKQNLIIIVANDVPKKIFKFGDRYLQKVVVWKIKDVKGADRTNINKKKIIRKIMKKVDKLNKNLGKK